MSWFQVLEDAKESVPLPRSGSDILSTRTEGPSTTLFISWGVMKIYCFLLEALAVSVSSLMLVRRLTASMKTSNSSMKRTSMKKTSIGSLKLTKAAQGAFNAVPKGLNERNSWERLFSSTQSLDLILAGLSAPLSELIFFLYLIFTNPSQESRKDWMKRYKRWWPILCFCGGTELFHNSLAWRCEVEIWACNARPCTSWNHPSVIV